MISILKKFVSIHYGRRCGSLLGSFVIVVASTTTFVGIELVATASPAGATGPYVTVIAGTGTSGYSGDGGPAPSADLDDPTSLVVDGSGNVFFIDGSGGSHYVREITSSTGNITTVPGLSSISNANGLAVDSAGNLYISTSGWYHNHVYQWTASTGVVSIFAGIGAAGYAGDGAAATSAELNNPQGLAIDSSGNLFIADAGNSVVRVVSVSTGDISTVAGDGTFGDAGEGGPATSAELGLPIGVAVDTSGNLFISDGDFNTLSKVSVSTGDLSTVATGSFSAQLAIDSSGNLYTPEASSIDEIDPATSTTTTLTGSYYYPNGVTVDASGDVFVANTYDHAIDEVSASPLPISFSPATLNFGDQDILTSGASQTVTVTNTSLSTLTISSDALSDGEHADFTKTSDSCDGVSLGSDDTCAITVTFTPNNGGTRWAELTFDDGISSGLNHAYLVGIGVGYFSHIAGTGANGYSGDGAAATSAELDDPAALVTGASGNIFILDGPFGGRYVREIHASSGEITAVSGLSDEPYANDLAIDDSGNLYFTTTGTSHNHVYEWTKSTATVSVFAGTGTAGHSGDGGPATSAELNDPQGLAVDASGNVFIADEGNSVVREVSASTGDISTVAGDGTAGDAGVGGPATSAELYAPVSVAVDASGNLFINDGGDDRMSEVSEATGDISTVASGTFNIELAVDASDNLFTTDGSYVEEIDPSTGSITPLAGSYYYANGVTVDSVGNVFVADTYDNQIDEISRYGSGFSGGGLDSSAIAQRLGGGGGIERGSCDCGTGDPIDTATGDFIENVTDASVATYGPALSFTRTYDATLAQQEAASSTPGPLGYGWTDNWATSLLLNTDYGTSVSGDVTFNQANGAQALFVPPVSGSCPSPYVGPGTSDTYCALPRVFGSLTYNAGPSTYTLVKGAGTTYTFNSSGELSNIADADGASESVTYDSPSPGSGHCPETATSCELVTSASGRTLTLGWSGSEDSGAVTTVTDPLGRRTTYAYSSGDLVSVTDPLSHVTSYTYDSENDNADLQHDLLTVKDPNEQSGGPDAGTDLANTYNAAGQVTSQTDAMGRVTSYDYSDIDPTTLNGTVVVTDPDGFKTAYAFNEGALVEKTTAYDTGDAAITTYDVDSSTLLDDSVTNPDDNVTSYTYDDEGNTLTKTNALDETWSYSYNDFNEVTCAAEPMAADPCSALSPPSAITAGTATITPPDSAPPKYVTYSEYDTDGNPIYATTGDYGPGDDSASQSRTTYDLYDGQSVTLDDVEDACTTSAPSSELPCATINADGVVTQLTYDDEGDVATSSTPDGNADDQLSKVTSGYNDDGERTSVVAPNGNLSGANAANFTTVTTYNDDGEPTAVTQGGGGGATVTARTIEYGYDAVGNTTSTTDAKGYTTDYVYDADDEQTLVTDPDDNAALTCYDGDGNVAQTVPAVGVADDSLTNASCPTDYPTDYGDRLASDATTYAYNSLGEKTTVTSPAPPGLSGYESTLYTYDPAGQLTLATAAPTSNSEDAANDVTAYTYNDAGELLTTMSGYGSDTAATQSYCYDRNGDTSASVAPDGNTSSVATCSGSSPYETSSGYQTGYLYDSLGELVTQTAPETSAAPDGQETSYTYDPAGNQLTVVNPDGVTATSTFTPLNHVATVSYSDDTPDVSYAYDANSNRTAMDDASGSSSFTYDPFDELASTTDGADTTTSYLHDLDGEVTGITYPLGGVATWADTDTVNYGYDHADELTSVEDFNGHTSDLTNSGDGLPTALTLGASGDTLSTDYAANDAPTSITLSEGSTLQEFAYSDVPSGAIASETDTPSSDLSPAAYAYDAQSRVTQETPGTDSANYYAKDASGNLTTIPTGASATHDDSSELTSSVLSDTTTDYTYDASGNRTQESVDDSATVSASFNGANELTSYSNAVANTSSATYDGDGLRTSATSTPTGGGETTQSFVWNTTTSVPVLLMDSTNAYIYGPNGTPFEQVNLSTGTIHYLVADVLGSVRGVVSSAGSLAASTSFDAWGNPQTDGGLNTYTPFGFAGGYTDPTGLLYFINRYYDPATGQFVSVDPMVNVTNQPYAYAGDDPVNAIDLNGLDCGLFSFACAAYDATAGGVKNVTAATSLWVATHKVAVGIALGVLTVVTGGAGLVAEGAYATTFIATSAVSSIATVSLDGSACAHAPGLTASCVATGLGAIGAIFSAPELLVRFGIIDEAAFREYVALSAAGIFASGTASLIDTTSVIYDDLSRTFGECNQR
jgi:RHS repeat-associated protein